MHTNAIKILNGQFLKLIKKNIIFQNKFKKNVHLGAFYVKYLHLFFLLQKYFLLVFFVTWRKSQSIYEFWELQFNKWVKSQIFTLTFGQNILPIFMDSPSHTRFHISLISFWALMLDCIKFLISPSRVVTCNTSLCRSHSISNV